MVVVYNTTPTILCPTKHCTNHTRHLIQSSVVNPYPYPRVVQCGVSSDHRYPWPNFLNTQIWDIMSFIHSLNIPDESTKWYNRKGTTMMKFKQEIWAKLTKHAKAYSSSCSQVILVYLHPFRRNSLFCSQKSLKNHVKSIFLGFKIIQGYWCWHS